MKKVHTPQNVAHLFANQLQSEARTQTSNLYFYNDKIYSYGSHFIIAAFNNDALLFTTRSYSNSTAKHINIVSSATNHIKKIFCAYPSGSHDQNFNAFLIDAENFAQKLKNARKPEIYINELNRIKNKAEKYANHFKIEIPVTLKTILEVTNKDQILLYMESKEKLIKAENLRKEKQEKKDHAAYLKKWKNHELQSMYKRIDFDYLRKDSENFQTSQGVKIPINVGLRFYKSILNNTVKINDQFLNYTIKDINKKFIVIGCHKITFKEIEKVIKQ
jgi:hypothetical protein